MSKEIGHRPPYNDRFERVKISEEDRIIGGKTFDLFFKKLRRPPAWNIKNGKVTIAKTGETIDGLEDEQISDTLARVIVGFKMVEDFLPDFMRIGNGLTRANMGLFMINTQWGNEELNHGLALGSILEQTDHKTRDQVKEEYQNNLERIWQRPFPTTRQIVAHAAFQERGTCLAYLALKKRAVKEGALKTAEIIELVAADEAYHFMGYKDIMDIYYEIDPEGTIEDILNVASEFRMPAENLHPKPLEWIKDLITVGVFSRNLVSEQIVYETLKRFGFISEEVARATADGFLKKRNLR